MGYGSHLIRRPHGIYYFRFTLKGGKEIRVSLRTSKVTIARRIAGLCSGVMWLNQYKGVGVTANELRNLVEYYYRAYGVEMPLAAPMEAVKKLDSLCSSKDPGLYKDGMARALTEIREKLDWVASHLTNYPSDLGGMLESYDISFPIFEEEREAAQFAQAQAQARAFFNTTPPVAQQNITTNPKSDNELLFSDAVKKFTTEMAGGENWRPKTQNQYKVSYDMFKELMGDLPVSSYKRTDISAYKDKLGLIPVSCQKKLPGTSYSKVVTMQHGLPILSITTRNKRLVELSSLFGWCEKNGYCEKNPADDIQIPRPKSHRKQDERISWSQEEFKLLINSLYEGNTVLWSHYYWLPLLGIYTGARINELAQLDVADVVDKEGIYCLDINGKVGGAGYTDENGNVGKQLKNSKSKRVIPLHSHLIKIGFLNFVKQRRNSGEKKLWEGLNPSDRDGWGTAPSKWFGREVNKLIKDGKISKGLTFHGLRHTFRDLLAGQPDSLVANFMGHVTGSITQDRYGSSTKPSILKDMIEQLQIDPSITDGLRWSDITVTGRKPYRKHIKPKINKTRSNKASK